MLSRILLGIRTLIVGTTCVFMIKNFVRLLKIGRVETSIIIVFLVVIVTLIVILFEPVIRHFFSKEYYIIVMGILASVGLLTMLFLTF